MIGEWFWWSLLAVALVGEAVALWVQKRPGDTLSELVWKCLRVRNRTGGAQAVRALTLLGVVWLVVHFLTGGWV